MNILVAIDSFKGSLSSLEAGNAVRDAILEIMPEASICVCPLADGGEGTMEALRDAFSATECEISSVSPRKRPIKARYYIKDTLAIMDMSTTAGLTLLKDYEKDPMRVTSFGFGLMIKDAIIRGCRDFIIGIGGSATNDAGAGMLQALGFELLDKDGNEAIFGALGAGSVVKIKDTQVLPELGECKFRVLCDVTNPLLGENGCTYVYAPQKGAIPEELPLMDKYLERFSRAVKEYNPASDNTYPGSGAAGGIGFAFMSMLGARLERGIDVVTEVTELEKKIQNADLVITGEGRMDAQSASGKAPIGVAKLAKKHQKRVIALCGITGEGYEKCLDCGIDEIHSVAREELTLSENMQKEIAINNILNTVKKLFK